MTFRSLPSRKLPIPGVHPRALILSRAALPPRHRAMSSSNPTPVATKHEFLVILPDHPNALDKRMSVRASHLSSLTPAVDSGFWTLGGATLAHPIADGQPAGPPPITGSVMLALATSEEEVRERLKSDVYFREGVWDWDRVVVYPFKSAFRKELQK